MRLLRYVLGFLHHIDSPAHNTEKIEIDSPAHNTEKIECTSLGLVADPSQGQTC